MLMTDQALQETPTSESLTGSVTALTAGQLIRAARQKKGVHLAVLSVNLKVPVRQLEALEADQHDPGKGPVFVRALASSVCRQLLIDPMPVLALLPKASGQMSVRIDRMLPLLSESRENRDMLGALRGLTFQTLLMAALMLMVIAALIWMPSPSTWSLLKSAPAVPVAVPEPAVMPEVSAEALPASQAAQIDSVVSAHSSSALASAPAAALPAPSVSVAAIPLSSSATSAGSVFNFAASQESWIEIRDVKNQVLWSRILRAGETAQVQYPLPMRVVVGHAKAVNVTYQGKPFDLAPHTKITVARFEVKE
jgi:cytoskeleton protein RodZ